MIISLYNLLLPLIYTQRIIEMQLSNNRPNYFTEHSSWYIEKNKTKQKAIFVNTQIKPECRAGNMRTNI